MPLLDIDLVKKHLRVTHDDDDDVIAAYQAAAEAAVTEYLDRNVYPAGDSPAPDDEYAIELRPSIVTAILLLVGNMYDGCDVDTDAVEGVAQPDGDVVLPGVIRTMLTPYRVWR
jgi:hypothetical protein